MKGIYSVSTLHRRFFALTVAVAFVFVVIVGRFFYVQVIWKDDLVLRALDQWNREIPIIADRGKITDRNATVLADNREAYTVYVRPNAVADKKSAARALSAILGTDKAVLYEKLKSSKVSEITVAKRVAKETTAEIALLNLSGVYFAKDCVRTYPYGGLLSQVIGFTSYDGYGVSGIERYYDEFLSGENGEILYATDLVGIEREDGVPIYKEATDGLNVVLTVDYGIQTLCESVMKRAYEETGAKGARCIVLDPNDFSVLAMVNCPNLDLNDLPREDVDQLNALSRNRLVSDVYEPGSTFKILTSAINLEEYYQGNPAAVSPSYVFSSARTRAVDGTTVKCWSNHENGRHSNQTLATALNNSCNPCFTDMALALGKDTVYRYLDLFGLGKVTGLDFSGEAQGMLLTQSAVRDCDLARIGFGQSVALTPLQLACAVASVINGGYYYTPRLVDRITDETGKTVYQSQARLQAKTVSQKTSDTLNGMLEGVVTEGSGRLAYIEGYRIAGKTGTAQKFEAGKLLQGKYVSSFIGYFPADDPKYLALIIVDEPQGAYYGSTVAAPLAKEIFGGIIGIKNISVKK